MSGFVGFNVESNPVRSLGFVGQNKSFDSYLIIKLVNSESSIISLDNLPIKISGNFTTIDLFSDSNGYAFIANREFDAATITVELEEFNAVATYNDFVQINQYIEVDIVSTTEKYKILTTKPRTRYVPNSQTIDYVYTLFFQSLTNIIYDITYIDGSTIRQEENQTFAAGLAYQHPVNFKNLKSIDSSKTVKCIKLFYSENQQSVIYWFKADKQSRPVTLYYRNSLGGYDGLYCEGYTTKRIKTTGISTRKTLPLNFNGTFRQNEVKGQLSTLQFTFNTGYKPAAEIAALADMFHNNEILMLDESKNTPFLRPLTITTNNTPITDNQSNLQAITFVAQEAIDKPYRWYH